MSGVQVIRIDDRDPSITYSGGSFSQGGNGNEYLSTTSRTNQVGATVTVSFTGTKIMIYGTIDSTALGTAPVSLFSVDGGRATQFVERQIDTGSQYQQKFYESPDLSPGAHQLVITISSVPSVRASFTFDYAEYYVSPSVASTSPSSTTAPVQITTVIVQQSASSDSTKSTPTSLSQSSSMSTSQSLSATRASSSTVPVSITSSNSPSSSHTDPSSNTSSAGTGNSQNDANTGASGVKSSSSSTPAIVGAVIGILVLLGILLCLFFLLKRRRARKAANSLGLYQAENVPPGFNPSTMIQLPPRRNTDVTPFLPQHRNHSNGNFESSHGGGAIGDPYPTRYMSEYYSSSSSASGRASSFDPSSSGSAAGASGAVYGIGAGFSKGAEARQERERIEEEELEQPPPEYES